jgi:hypothetical protein
MKGLDTFMLDSMQGDTNLVLVIGGYVMTGVLAVIWWFYRGSVVRPEEYGSLR